MSSNDRDDLTHRVRAGDSDALAEAFEIERSRLGRIVRFRLDPRLLGRIDVEDVLQEAYLDAASRINHYAGEEDMSLIIWLRLILNQTLSAVHRRHLDAQARDVRREMSMEAAAGPNTSICMARQLAGSLTSPSGVAVREEAAKRLRDALDDMDPIDREILALRHFEELGNAEAAEALGITPKAASMRYVRAIQRLKDILSVDP